MAIVELSTVIGAIVKMGVQATWEKTKRREAVIRTLERVGLKSDAPPSDFDGVYAYTLVEYGLGKPKPILEFFRHKFIRDAFRQSFENRDLSILNEEAENLIQWHEVGDDLRRMDVDPRREFARFTAVFNEIVNRTRTPAQIREGQKLDDIHGDLHQRTGEIIERLDRVEALADIRSELERLARGYEALASTVALTDEDLRVEHSRATARNYSRPRRTPRPEELLRKTLSRLELQKLKTMWFDLTRMDWNELEGSTKSEKVLSLISYFGSRGRLSEVYDWMEREERDLWDRLPPLSAVSQ